MPSPQPMSAPRALAVLLLAGVVLAPAALSANGRSFRTGRYAGKTSQGAAIVFSVTMTKFCGGPERTELCLIQKGRVAITATCSDGTKETSLHENVAQVVLGRSGVVNGTSVIDDLSWHIVVRTNGTLAGYLHLSESKPTNDAVSCHSGKVSFSAKLGR